MSFLFTHIVQVFIGIQGMGMDLAFEEYLAGRNAYLSSFLHWFIALRRIK